MLKLRAIRVSEYETGVDNGKAKEIILTETPAPEPDSGRNAVSLNFTLPDKHPAYKDFATGVTFSLKADKG